MKRNENIVLLSKDHHFGLLCAWKINKGLKDGISPERIATFVKFYWENNQCKHFEEEERYLFPYIDNELTRQALAEHQQMREMVGVIINQHDTEVLALFAELLKRHIRYEERELFPYMEAHLSDDTLAEIGRNLGASHHTERDDYDDPFWL
ncbi:hemerythrin domain-containing protein [Capnocytophaga haemolytica]|jgi:hemerythrin HHE cation binding domain protein